MGTLSDVQTLAERPLEDQIRILRSLGDDRIADELEHKTKTRALFGLKPWQHSSHRIGFIAPSSGPTPKQLPILSAADLTPDTSLIGTALDIKLDRLCVVDYPGGGIHEVLVTFDAVHGTEAESLTFNQAYQVPEGDNASVAG